MFGGLIMESETRTSDEILEELFSALNVPLSPKTQKKGAAAPASEKSHDNSCDSEGSENNKEEAEADSKSSAESEGHEEEKVGKNHKHKTSKKKKEKKKKKKKHRKKDDDSRHHKSKKKHRKESLVHLEEEEEENASKMTSQVAPPSKAEEEVGEKLSAVEENEQTEKSFPGVRPNHLEMEKRDLGPKSKSPRRSEEELSKSLISPNTKGKNDNGSDSGSKEEPSKKLTMKLSSPQRSHSGSKSARSRSRSTSRVQQQRHTRHRHGRHSRSRSRSRSKHDHRQSRSRSRSSSRTKSSSIYKYKAKSPHGLDKLKRKRKSRSRSRSLSPKHSKRQRLSRSRSRSISPKKTKRRSSRSYSKSVSPKLSKKKRYSRSRSSSSPKMSSKQRSRSRSGSHKRSPRPRETSSSTNPVPENSSFKLETSKDQKSSDIDLSSIPTPAVKQQQLGCPTSSSKLPIISLESIPLPIPPVSSSSGLPDPSSIPLPQAALLGKAHNSGKEPVEAVGGSTGIDVGTIPVPVAAVETPTKEQEPPKSADTGSEKGKGAKIIIIKSLKDSLIYMQAQEEAERRAKSKQDDQEVQEVPIIQDKEPEAAQEDNVKEEDSHQEEKQPEVVKEKVEEKDKKEKDEEKDKKEIKDLKSNTDKAGIEDDLNGMEEGEIAASAEEEVAEEVKTKSHKKKSKKDKDKSKEKKKAKKEKSKEKKRRSREKSKSKERANKSRSKSKERSKHKRSSSSWHRDRDGDRRYRRYSRSRSRSRDRFSRFRRDRSYSRSRSRSRSRSGRKRDCVTDLRDKVTRKRLLEIARRNAVYLMQNGCLPPSVEQEQLVKIKTGGKSVEELTDFCKQLVATGNYSDVELSDPSLSSDDDNDNPEKPFSYTRHPFSVRDSKPILMNIRNAPMLPTKTNAERLADHAKLREQFPVSSGSQHRNKGEVTTPEDKLRAADHSGWVPVSPKEKLSTEEDTVFSKEEPPSVDISQIVSSRLSAMRKLQDNPNDIEALKTLHNVQKEMQSWALSKQEPGQFTGSTGVKILSQEELCAGQQAWVRKEQFKEAAPVRPQFGLKMLQKMGWTPGEGLGKNKEGAIEPLLLDVKMDKKGFHAQEELTPKKQPIPMAKDLSGKHPVSALVELCSKHKWQPPEFEMVFDYGPDHKKNFLMKVKVNNAEYKPAVAGPTKKLAKANAAAACLQSLGLIKDSDIPSIAAMAAAEAAS